MTTNGGADIDAGALIADVRRRLDGEIPSGWDVLAEQFVRVLQDDGLPSAADIAGAIRTHWTLGHRRRTGETLVQVVSPDASVDGWSSPHSVVFVVCDDASFLVDSLRIALERAHLAVHLLVHPMLHVTRAADGAIRSLGERRAPLEAWVMIEVDRIRPDEFGHIDRIVRDAVAEVHLAVGDFEAMRLQMSDVASDIEHLPPASVDAHEAESVVRLLRWLTRRHFVFLGAATYDCGANGSLVHLEGSGLGLLRRAHTADPPPAPHVRLLDIARADVPSNVHRPTRPLCIAVRRFDAAGRVQGEHRFVGLLAASAYRASVLDIPHVKERAAAVVAGSGFPPESHDGRALRNILETFPRDEILGIDGGELTEIAGSILALADRQVVRAILLPSTAGEWSTMLVYIPRSRFHVRLVERIGDAIAELTDAVAVEADAFVGTGALARIDVTLRQAVSFDLGLIERTVDDLTRPWTDDVRLELTRRFGEADGLDIADRVLPGIPADYRAATTVQDAVEDLLIADRLDDGRLLTRIVAEDARSGTWRVRILREGVALSLSDLVPVLENLGMRVRDERAHVLTLRRVQIAGASTNEARTAGISVVHVHDVRVDTPVDENTMVDRRDEVQRTLELVLDGAIESDGFNRLVLLAGLTSSEAAILRSYAKYLRQIGFPFSQQYIEETLARHPDLARALIQLFVARTHPSPPRPMSTDECMATTSSILDRIPNLDDDRIGRTLARLIQATVRTNAHCDGHRALSLKFDPTAVPDLPAPRPWAEIWVCSPFVEGVHLRGGPIARGGIRWSDRREDFRTEVLGLVKAQMVKNAVIVPVGAKGGFVVKRPMAFGVPPTDISRDEVVACYRDFITALLDVTDDIRDGHVVPPAGVVRHDGDDPYLVVAADKGTSNLSDVANEVATSRGFWLGDAFASGGSVGYDHKEMGITARGAWESVRRHARTLGLDADRDPLTVVGIGDMSGDVFGNGLLRSRHLRLVAAFDHRHIFLDPDPDPETSFAERQRLFDLERSSWADYDPALLSAGGMVVPRSAKQIEVSDEVRARLDVPSTVMTPDELVQAVLRAPVDVLWNGGIGTYVKASTERHLDVGDRSNDALRIDGGELRCRIVAEGGNLGFTQRGRIEAARSGRLINTDAIDNSAGVDCSDHEVNIKILLADAMASGRLDVAERDALLASMTDEVADLVLDDNRAQTLALAIARRRSLDMVDVHRRYLDALEAEGWLDRALEFLPTDRELADRQAAGEGLTTPEFAVLLAYTKNADITEVVRSDLPDDTYLAPLLHGYFPAPLRERFPELVARHRLRREIIATSIVNQMVNTSGITFDHRLTEETGASTADVVRAWIVARDIVGADDMWGHVEDLVSHVKPEVHVEMLVELRRMVERCTLWVLRHRRPPIDMADTVDRLSSGVRRVQRDLPEVLVGPLASLAHSQVASRLVAGVPEDLATDAAMWPFVHTAFDVVDVALDLDVDPVQVASVYWELFDRLGAIWLWEGIGALPRTSRWSSQARNALRDDLLATLADLTRDIVTSSPGTPADEAISRWFDRNRQSVTRAQLVQSEIVRSGTQDVTTLAVSLRQLRNLLLTSRAASD